MNLSDYGVFGTPSPRRGKVGKGARKLLRIMKLTFILLTAAALQVSAEGNSQTVTLDVKDAPVQTVLREVIRQTGVSIVYDEALLAGTKPVTLKVKDATVEEVLRKSFENQSLGFRIEGNKIVIQRQPLPPSPPVQELSPATPDTLSIRGKVVDSTYNPLAGASIQVQGTNKGTTTNAEGVFSVNVNEGDILTVTFVGYQPRKIVVTSSMFSSTNNLIITLSPSITALGDVQVTVNTGYERVPKERATGSFQFVNKEELNRRVGPDLLSRLEGVTTGILFDRRSLSPNQIGIGKSNIQIRGISTLTETMKTPLIVLNNFPYEGDINNINPNDVESITILKDAAAASIWGAKAANGVIVITTKTGQYNTKPQIALTTNFNFVEEPDLFKLKQMSSSDFIEAEAYFFRIGLYNSNINNTSSFPALTPVVEILNKRRSGQITPSDSATQIDILRNTDVRNDFSKYVYRNSTQQQYNLQVSGGSQFVRYMISGGFDRNPNSLIGNTSNRATLLSNTVIQLSKRFDITLNINYSDITQTLNSLGNIGTTKWQYKASNNLYQYARFSDENGNALPIVKDYRSGYIDTAGKGKLLNWQFVPLDEMSLADNTFKQQEAILNIGFSYKIHKSLQLQGSYQYQNAASIVTQHYQKETYFARNLINLYSQINNDEIMRIIPNNGILEEFQSDLKSHIGRAQINYNQKLATKHEIAALAGFEIREKISTSNGNRVYGYNENYLSTTAMDYITEYKLYGNRGKSKVPRVQDLGKTTDHFVSAFGNMSYTFDRRYTFSASVRRDASNLFGIDLRDKWKPFWTIGTSWNLSNEAFYKLNFISYLRLRATYGYQGNVNNSISPYTLMNYIGGGSPLNGLPQAFITNPANPGLTWETLKQTNVGIDFRIKGDRVLGSIDYFSKRSNDLLLGAINDPTSGVNSVTKNSANMSGKGIEFSLTTVNINRNNFRWSTELGFSYVTNKLLDYKLDDAGFTAGSFGGSNGAFISKRIGKSPYTIYSFPFGGLDQLGNPLGYNGKEITTNYRSIFDQQIDTANLIDHGSSIPTKFGFLNNIFSYKGINITVGVSYSLGYYFKKSTISYFALLRSNRGHADYAKRWRKPGDENVTTVPSITSSLSSSRRDDFYANSSANVLKGDNIRLQYIRAGYSLNKSFTEKLHIQSVQFFATLNNIGILWRANKEKLDPDYDYGNAAFPIPKTFALGANIIF